MVGIPFILLVLAATLTFPYPALANPGFAKYEHVATSLYGAPDCPQGIEKQWYLEDDPVFGSAVGWGGGCQIFLDWEYWMSVAKPIRCAIFGHEWLHLLGYDHGPKMTRQERRLRRPCNQPPFVRRVHA
jgi:hypothetical protein